jgi:hypothetical protein
VELPSPVADGLGGAVPLGVTVVRTPLFSTDTKGRAALVEVVGTPVDVVAVGLVVVPVAKIPSNQWFSYLDKNRNQVMVAEHTCGRGGCGGCRVLSRHHGREGRTRDQSDQNEKDTASMEHYGYVHTGQN